MVPTLCMQVAFMLPTVYPIEFANFNYAPISVVVAVAIICLAWYFPRIGARSAFLEGSRSLAASASNKVSHLHDLSTAFPLPLEIWGYSRVLECSRPASRRNHRQVLNCQEQLCLSHMPFCTLTGKILRCL